MQRFKRHFSDERGKFSGGHPHMDSYGKFVYGAPGTLCRYAQWSDEQIERLADVRRYLKCARNLYSKGFIRRAKLNAARDVLHDAKTSRALATLSLVLCDGRAGMFD